MQAKTMENFPSDELSKVLGGLKSGKSLLDTLAGSLNSINPGLAASIGHKVVDVVKELKSSPGAAKATPAAPSPAAVDTSSAKSLISGISTLTPRGKFDLAFFAESVTLVGKTTLVSASCSLPLHPLASAAYCSACIHAYRSLCKTLTST